MKLPDSFFGSMTPEAFLKEYWQKKPLLVRGAWPGFAPPFSVQEFQELSMREDAIARLIVRSGEQDWKLLEGPFAPRDFARLPGRKWTLLIQEVDRLVEDVHGMLGVVDFLPNWRLDDVMVSYAMPEGGVGAHIDNYDVFLLQGMGRRRWQIESRPVDEELLLEDVEVSILANFNPDEDWILEPGDMLYLPPRIPHRGDALDPCMTFSIGCRAPSAQELVAGLFEKAMTEIDPDERFADPEHGSVSGDEGLMGSEVLEYVRQQMLRLIEDEDLLKESIGALLSEPRRYVGDPEEEGWADDESGENEWEDDSDDAELNWAGDDLDGAGEDWTGDSSNETGPDSLASTELLESLRQGARLRPISAPRGLHDQTSNGEVLLFLSGEVFRLDPALLPVAAALTSRQGLGYSHLAARSANGSTNGTGSSDPGSPSDLDSEVLDFLVELLGHGLIKLVR